MRREQVSPHSGIEPHLRNETTPPVFGMILLGGSLVGAQVRDIRLANELHRRGFKVHVWWGLDRPRHSSLHPEIPQRWLFHSFRYLRGRGSRLGDASGRVSSWMLGDRIRGVITQRFSKIIQRSFRGLIRAVCRGIEQDQGMVRRFARELRDSGVTHVLPNIEIFAPFVEAARPLVPYPLRSLVTFQGYETYANYAREIGLEDALYRKFREAVALSGGPAVAVSREYSARIQREVGLSVDQLVAIPPGIPFTPPLARRDAEILLRRELAGLRPELPLISYLGRRDAEKGLDLLLYAAKILSERGVKFQLALCGPTAFGSEYLQACRQIGEHLRIHVLWGSTLSNEARSALFQCSRCVVYPSIHEEAFGMVPVEAMMQGTPVIVPDTGGVSQLPFRLRPETNTTSGAMTYSHGTAAKQKVGPIVHEDGAESPISMRVPGIQAGLTFQSWNSGDLAAQLERILTDDVLHAAFCQAAPGLAAEYSVERLGDRILALLGISCLEDQIPARHRNCA